MWILCYHCNKPSQKQPVPTDALRNENENSICSCTFTVQVIERLRARFNPPACTKCTDGTIILQRAHATAWPRAEGWNFLSVCFLFSVSRYVASLLAKNKEQWNGNELLSKFLPQTSSLDGCRIFACCLLVCLSGLAGAFAVRGNLIKLKKTSDREGGGGLTVLLPRFLTRQLRYAVLPSSAVTFFEAATSKYGPTRDCSVGWAVVSTFVGLLLLLLLAPTVAALPLLLLLLVVLMLLLLLLPLLPALLVLVLLLTLELLLMLLLLLLLLPLPLLLLLLPVSKLPGCPA